MENLTRPNDVRRLYQKVADQIRSHIYSGEFPKGSRLPPERELAQLIGVSRPSLREALIALEIEGAVEVRSGSGVYVTLNIDVADSSTSLGESPSEIMDARASIEGAVAAKACARVTNEGLTALQNLLENMRATIHDGGVPLDQDRQFHVMLAAQTGNSVLMRIVGELFDERQGIMLAKLRGQSESSDTWRKAQLEHELIYAALEAKDPGQAEAAMRMHLHNSAVRWLGT
ncbi:FadR/GntR family transcriptional regulator [Paraburkholderia fynbosensis]|uniref:L-lactate dehydrogenase operon regulatory protein n=1 Tax=Paraburkholderia fynbosensis TaxID=1200993 RepID=A0A6J5H1V4_9BURK|nr:FadR/GntR family transcriptional regulator [Paraburkholderia fynbosensis]CAB3809729.1 Putative L-lactate dehydrogenase operon regulatory protein [Paraburkholderia fynbosensis]